MSQKISPTFKMQWAIGVFVAMPEMRQFPPAKIELKGVILYLL